MFTGRCRVRMNLSSRDLQEQLLSDRRAKCDNEVRTVEAGGNTVLQVQISMGTAPTYVKASRIFVANAREIIELANAQENQGILSAQTVRGITERGTTAVTARY